MVPFSTNTVQASQSTSMTNKESRILLYSFTLLQTLFLYQHSATNASELDAHYKLLYTPHTVFYLTACTPHVSLYSIPHCCTSLS